MLPGRAEPRWAPACGAGRAPGMRVTAARFFTGRRAAGRTTGLGGAVFFLAADLRDTVFGAGRFTLADLDLAVRFLPEPFDVFLAMALSCCLRPPALYSGSGPRKHLFRLEVRTVCTHITSDRGG